MLAAGRVIGAGMFLCLSPLTSYLSPLSAQSAPPAKIAQSIERTFGPGSQIDSLKVDTATVLRISQAGTLLGFAAVRNIKGKDQPITYLVAIDPKDALKDIDILVYREPYGGEVAYEPWRKQFRGKTSADPLTVGKDVKNISGATISSHSVTLGVRRTLTELAAWHAAGKIR
ncbi:MAG TPA: FMN-binding protein [Gemmatimonadales bacterium]|nr:FMN-binding protein [Gemmatimonadales bacterium]